MSKKIVVLNTAVNATSTLLQPDTVVKGHPVYRVPSGARIALSLDGQPLKGKERVNGKTLSLKKVGAQLQVLADDEVLLELHAQDASGDVVLEGGQWPVPVEALADSTVQTVADTSAAMNAASVPADGLTTTPVASTPSAVKAVATGEGVQACVGMLDLPLVNAGTAFAAAAALVHAISGDAAPSSIVNGYVVAGPVIAGNGLTVKLYAADGKTLLATSAVDPVTGQFTADVGAYTGVVIAVVSDKDTGNDYIDEATGLLKDLNVNLTAVGVVVAGQTLTLNINPLTTVAAQKLGLNADASVPATLNLAAADAVTQVKATNQAVGQAFGVSDILSDTVVATVNTDGSTNPEANIYGKVLASLSGMDSANAGDAQATVTQLVNALDVSTGSLADNAKADIIKGAVTAAISVADVASAINGASNPITDSLKSASQNALYSDVVTQLSSGDAVAQTKVDSLDELNALAAKIVEVQRVVDLAAPGDNGFTSTLTASDFAAMGVNGVTADNLPAVLRGLAAVDSASTQSALLSAVDGAVSVFNSSSTTIANYADLNSGTVPQLSDYTALAVSGIGGAGQPTVAMINEALATAEVVKTEANTAAGVQAIVNAYNAVLSFAGAGTTALTAAPYVAIGVSMGNAATDVENLALLNDIVDVQGAAGVSTVAQISQLATIVNALQATAAGTAPGYTLTDTDFSLIGLTGVNSGNLSGILASIALRANDGGQTDSRTELQALINTYNKTVALSLQSDTGNTTDWITSNGQVNLNLPSGITTWQYSTDGGSSWTTGSATSFTLSAADYTAGQVQVVGYDAAGNPTQVIPAVAISVDAAPPTATLTAGTAANTASATVQSTETGMAYLVKTGGTSPVSVTNLASITGALDSKWNSVAISAVNTNTSLSLAGLEDGTYTLYTTDVAGNLSTASTTTFTVDTTAPNAATLMSVTDNDGLIQGLLSDGDTTDDNTPTLRFDLTGSQVVAGEHIQLYNGNTALGSAQTITQTDIDNGYVVVIPSALYAGSYNFHAKLIDAVGNESQASTSLTGTIIVTSDQRLQGMAGNLADADWNWDQNSPDSSMTALSDGGYVIAWTAYTSDGQGTDIFIQRYNADNSTIGEPIRQQSQSGGVDDIRVQLAALPDAGYVVTWSTGVGTVGDTDIHVQRFNLDNQAVGGIQVLEGEVGANDFNPQVTALNGGGYVMTWRTITTDSAGVDIFLRAFSASGAALGTLQRLGSTLVFDDGHPSVAALSDGGFVVSWSGGTEDSRSDIFAQRYDNQAQAFASRVQIAGEVDGIDNVDPSVCALSNGDYVLTWSGTAAGNGLDVYLQRYSAGSMPAGGLQQLSVQTGSVDSSKPKVVALTDGGYVVAWSEGTTDGQSNDIFVQRYSAQNQPVGTGHRVSAVPAMWDDNPNVVALPSGGYVLAWATHSVDDVASTDIYVQQFGAADQPLSAPQRIQGTEGTFEDWGVPQIKVLQDGSYVVSWQGDTSDGQGFDVFAQRFTANGLPWVDSTAPTATLSAGTAANTASATVQSTESGMAYLVKTGGSNPVTVSHLSSITGAPDAQWNSVAITRANTNTSLSLAGLEDGTYALYTADAAGNLSTASANTFTVDSSAPTATLITGAAANTASATVQSTETGTAYLVKTGGAGAVTVTDLASITGAADAKFNSVAITSANSNTSLSLAGLEDGTYTLYTTDAAGNLSAASANTFTVDNSAPTVTGVSIASARGETITSTSVGPWTFESVPTGSITTYRYQSGTANTQSDWDLADAAGSDSDLEERLYSGLRTGHYHHLDATTLASGQTASRLSAAFKFGFDASQGDGLNLSFGDKFSLWDYDHGYNTGLSIRYSAFSGTGYKVTIRWNGELLATSASALALNTEYTTTVDVNDAGEATVKVNGVTYASATLTNWASTNMAGWQFGYGGRTEGVAGTGWVDDLSVAAAVKTSNASQTTGLNVSDVVSVTANFSEAVTVTGTPQLALNIGGSTVLANYASGSGSTALTFTYTIQANQTDPNGISVDAGSISLNGGSIRDATGNNAVPNYTQVADNASYSVDTSAPTATLTAGAAANTASATVQSTETGTAYLVKTGGSDPVTVSNLSNILGALDTKWNSVAISAVNTNTSLSLAGLEDGTYTLYTTDAAGNLSTASANTYTVDGAAPTVTGVAITGATGIENSTLNAGDVVTATVTFSEAVTVTGTPRLALNIGGTTVQANYASGSSTAALTFTYTILATQTDANGTSIAANALALNGGGIADAAGNAATLTHALVSDNASYLVDTSITAAPSGSHTVAISSDSGTAGDRITNDSAVQVNLTLGSSLTLAGDETLQVSADGSTWVQATGSGTSWSTANNAVSLGASGTLTARIVDTAGNTQAITLSSNDYTLDTSAPTPTLTAGAGSNTASATVQSTETGTAYLVKTGGTGAVTVTNLASIMGAADAKFNSVDITSPSSNTTLSLAGLEDGTYRLYTTDAAGNLSAASANTFTVDSTVPVLDLDSSNAGTLNVSATTETAYSTSGGSSAINLGTVTGSAITFSTWVSIDERGDPINLNANHFRQLVNITPTDGMGDKITVYMNGPTNLYCSVWRSDGVLIGTVYREVNWSLNTWNHLGFIVDTNGYLALFVNGVKVVFDGWRADYTTFPSKERSVTLGNDASGTSPFDATFSDVRVYTGREYGAIARDMAGALDTSNTNLRLAYSLNGSLNSSLSGGSAATTTGTVSQVNTATPTSLDNVSGSAALTEANSIANINVDFTSGFADSTANEILYVGTTALTRGISGSLTLTNSNGTIAWDGATTTTWDYAYSGTTLTFTSASTITAAMAQSFVQQLAYANKAGASAASPATPRVFTITVTDAAGNTSAPVTATMTVNTATPLMLDLNGDGVHTTALSHGVLFDVQSHGQPLLTGWSDGHDGLLVLDLNHDGRINDGSELFGSGMATPTGKAANGYEALRQYDTNADGVIDARDAVFKDLQLWVDANIDGVTDAGELHSLTQLGVASLNLMALPGSQTDKGNTLGLVSSWTDTNGQVHDMADVWFNAQTLESLVSQASGTQVVNLANNGTADVKDVHLSDVLQAPQKLLVVQADADDVVRVDATGWVDTGTTTTVDNRTYALWSNSMAHLLIDQHARVQAVL